ncbi:ATP-binding cassette domain-containing protein [Bradyrhizobium lablabi]|uniref:ATP-binding cassette domain-containing protein n=1 Tax=Bradyrhizobium lablabi TaxID=722472 RepID=UPI0024BF23BB|nr:hypothetical protein [Bradyrhizobium lablabi]
MLQQAGLMPWKIAQDNIGLRLVLQGKSVKEARAEARFGVTGFEQRYPHQLSGGQRKRAAMQTLITEPRVFLLDERFSALDVHTRRLMHRILLRQAGRRSLIFITHDLDEAITQADQVGVMSAGPASGMVGELRKALPDRRDVSALQTTDEFVALYLEICSLPGAKVEKSYAGRTKLVVAQGAIFVALVPISELGVRSGIIDAFLFPGPSTLVVGRMREWTSTPNFRGDVGITLVETILSTSAKNFTNRFAERATQQLQ